MKLQKKKNKFNNNIKNFKIKWKDILYKQVVY